MILGPSGARIGVTQSRPEPNPGIEERFRKMLKSIDPTLDISWFPNAIINQKTNKWEGRYAVIVRWPESDARWQLYREGIIEEPVDFIGWFCQDIHDAYSMPVEIDQIENKVIELLGKCDNQRFPWQGRMGKVLAKNAKRRADIRALGVDEAVDALEYMRPGKIQQTVLQVVTKD